MYLALALPGQPQDTATTSNLPMTDADRAHWEARYTSGEMPVHATANRWLMAQVDSVDAAAAAAAAPPVALDVACGTGATLLWLARRGWHVTGVDISPTALAQARARLGAAGLLHRATLIQADLDTWRPDAARYNLVTCFYFLDRRLWPLLRAAVLPAGLICLNTYHTGRMVARPETNPSHLLEPGELAALIEGWRWRLLAAQTDAQMEGVLAQGE
jgi:tellurite methyltransferase